MDGKFLPYTNAVPYFLILTSLGSGFSGVIIGSVAVFVIIEASDEWFRKVRPPCFIPKRMHGVLPTIREADGVGKQVLMRSQLTVWMTITILSLPFFFIMLSTWTISVGE